MTDEEIDAALLPLRSSTALGRLNMAECRVVYRAMESAGLTKPSAAPATTASNA